MKTVVIFYSLTGKTAKIAEALAAKGCTLLRMTDIKTA